MATVAWLQLRQMLAGKKVWMLTIFLLLPAGLSALIAAAGEWRGGEEEELLKAIYLFMVYPQAVCLLLALLYGTSLLNAELEEKTITYLFTRPVPRWKVFLGKYAALVPWLAAPSLASLTGSWLLLGRPGGAALLGGMALAVLGSVAVYGAIFGLVGVVFRTRTLVIGVLYAVIFEFFLSFLPAVVSALSVTHYLRSVVLKVTDLEVPEEVLVIVGNASLLESAGVLGAIALAAVGLASFVCTRREYVVAEQL